MPTPTIPSTGKVDMNSIQNAFPGLSNPPNLAEFIGMHPSLPSAAGSSISFGQFHGLTAVSPSFSFSNVALSNGTVTASNGTLMISGTASVSKVLSGSISLSNYLSLVNYNAPVTFALSNGSLLPTGVSLGTNGILSHALTAAVTSTARVIVTNRWGNIASIPLSYNILLTLAQTPYALANAPVYNSYNGSTYPVSWSFVVTNTTSCSILTYFSFSGTPSGVLSGNVYTLTGYVSPNTTPSITLSLTNVVSGYATNTVNTALFTSSVASPTMPFDATPTANSSNTSYGAFVSAYSAYAVTWTFGVSNATSVSINSFSNFYGTPTGSLSGNVYTVTGYVISSTTPYIMLSLTNAIAGYNTSTANLGFTAPISSPSKVNRLMYSSANTNSSGYVSPTGLAYMWGANGQGELGNNSTMDSLIPVKISTFGSLISKTVTSISCGQMHTIALDTTGAVHAWGYNYNGQLGNSNMYVESHIPVQISTFGSLVSKTVNSIACGPSYTIALDATGTVHSWGLNRYGQLGNNTTTDSQIPVQISTFGSLVSKTITSIACGSLHTIALDTTGVVHAWGNNGNGALGNGSFTDSHIPVLTSTYGSIFSKTITSIACGPSHTVALDTTGAVHTWGYNNYGQLGNNSVTQSPTPGSISGYGSLVSKTITSIACGGNFTVALDTTGAIHVWGLYIDMNGTDVHIPMQFMTGSLTSKTVTSIACGMWHALVLDTTGAIHVWGYNTNGQLGDGSALLTNYGNPTLLPNSAMMV